MTESQINYFLAVAKEKSISKASETLFVSQPAVSKQIALLENELGCKLFERHTRGLDLTSAGKSFEKLFLEFKIRLKETLETIHAEQDVLKGKYTLGVFDGWLLSEFSLDLFEFLRKKYPKVEFDVMSFSIEQIIYALKRGEINDILATESILEVSPDLIVRHICSIATILLFSSSHPLASKNDLSLSDFADCTFYVTAPQNMMSGISYVLKLCNNAGFSPHIEYVPTLSAIRNKLQSTDGVFIGNEWIIDRVNPIFKSITLPDKIGIGFASLKESIASSSPFNAVRNDVLEFYLNKYQDE